MRADLHETGCLPAANPIFDIVQVTKLGNRNVVYGQSPRVGIVVSDQLKAYEYALTDIGIQRYGFLDPTTFLRSRRWRAGAIIGGAIVAVAPASEVKYAPGLPFVGWNGDVTIIQIKLQVVPGPVVERGAIEVAKVKAPRQVRV